MAQGRGDSRSYGQKVLDSAIGVEEGGAHGAVDVGPCEAHALHVGDSGLALAAHGQGRGIVELGTGRGVLCGRGRGCGRRMLGRSGGGGGSWGGGRLGCYGCGCRGRRFTRGCGRGLGLGDHADDEALLLDAVRLDRVGILQNLACGGLSATGAQAGGGGRARGADQSR